MKSKTICSAGFLAAISLTTSLSFNSLAQNGGGINIKIDPKISAGYTTWNKVDGASTYTVKTFLKEVNNSYTELSSVSTTHNYFQFDPLIFQIPNIHYQVQAQNGSNALLDDSDIIWTAYEGYQGTATYCTKICNGTSYAYKMTLGAPVYTQYGTTNYGPASMSLSSTYRFYDTQNAVAIPYWLAMSYTAYNSLPGGHPYTQTGLTLNSNGTYTPLYMKEEINSTISVGPFFDQNNNAVQSGWLIEKKLNQYNHWGTWVSQNTLALDQGDCATNLQGTGGWITMANSNPNQVIMPTVTNPFTNTVVTNLECINAYGSLSPGPNGANWNAWVLAQYAQVKQIEDAMNPSSGGNVSWTWNDFAEAAEELSNIVSPTGGFVTGLVYKCISNEEAGTKLTFTRTNQLDPLRLREGTGDMDPGLYSIVVHTSESEVLPFYLKSSAEIPAPKQKEFLEFVVAPNPIVNSTLNCNMTAASDISFNILVHNMYGSLLANETKSLTTDDIYQYSLNIDGLETPLNQILVTLVFQDGSTIQKMVVTN